LNFQLSQSVQVYEVAILLNYVLLLWNIKTLFVRVNVLGKQRIQVCKIGIERLICRDKTIKPLILLAVRQVEPFPHSGHQARLLRFRS